MKAAIYLRVSSRDGRQDEANQEPACRGICEARGWEPVIYRERESGGVRARPVWRSVMEAARLGQVRAVVVWALDRIGRDREQITHDVDELLRWRVQVVAVNDPWVDQRIGSHEHDLMMQLMGWVAAGFRKRLSDNTKAGQARARAKGKHIGRPGKISQGVIHRALWIKATGVGWGTVAKQLTAEGHPVSKGAIERAVARYEPPSQIGSENGVPNPAPAAGFRPPGGGVSN